MHAAALTAFVKMFKRFLVLSMTFNIFFCFNYESNTGTSFNNLKTTDGSANSQNSYLDLQRQNQNRKGQHEFENRKENYAEDDGRTHKSNHEDGYLGGFLNTNQSQQGYDFNETGSYAKGHKTKGHHNIHKLNELKRKTNFFDDNFDAFGKERHGKYEHQKKNLKGNFNLHASTADAFNQKNKKIQDFLDQNQNFFKTLGFRELLGQNNYYKNFNVFDANQENRDFT